MSNVSDVSAGVSRRELMTCPTLIGRTRVGRDRGAGSDFKRADAAVDAAADDDD